MIDESVSVHGVPAVARADNPGGVRLSRRPIYVFGFLAASLCLPAAAQPLRPSGVARDPIDDLEVLPGNTVVAADAPGLHGAREVNSPAAIPNAFPVLLSSDLRTDLPAARRTPNFSEEHGGHSQHTHGSTEKIDCYGKRCDGKVLRSMPLKLTIDVGSGLEEVKTILAHSQHTHGSTEKIDCYGKRCDDKVLRSMPLKLTIDVGSGLEEECYTTKCKKGGCARGYKQTDSSWCFNWGWYNKEKCCKPTPAPTPTPTRKPSIDLPCQSITNIEALVLKETQKFSEENDGYSQHTEGPIEKVYCFGDYCDEKKLQSKKLEPTDIGDGTWTGWFSEEDGGVKDCPPNTFVERIRCRDSYCDDMNLYCVLFSNGGHYRFIEPEYTKYWSNEFSEEGEHHGSCGAGLAVVGMKCRGSNCDNITLRCRKWGKTECVGPDAGSNPLSNMLKGKTDCDYGSADCNVCVENVSSALTSVKVERGNLMGFNVDNDIVTAKNHWQGVTRLSSGGGMYLALTTGSSDDGGTLRIVKMGSRASAGSSKFGPNRSSPEEAPPKDDRLLQSSTRTSSDYKHGGGIQAVGNILGVTMDQPKSSIYPEGKVLFYDVSDPGNPVLKKELTRAQKVGAAGLTKLANENFLMVVGGFDDNKKLDFYELNEDLDPLRKLQWDKDIDGVIDAGTGIGNCWPYDTLLSTGCGNAYQSLSLVTQCSDGKVFMIGMHAETPLGWGYDRADLYELTLSGDKIKPKKVYESNDFKCGRWDGVDQCSFAAAGGIYIDPAGKLIFYGVEHDNDGPKGSGETQNSVKMVEFYYD